MSSPPRRRYESPLRRQQVTETRERILAAGSALAHELSAWDWRGLTVRAVAGRAGVHERTVYRHFSNERALRDAVMRRLEQEAGDPLDGLTLEGLAPVVARVFAYLSSFATAPRTPTDPTFVEVDQRRREALLAAVERSAGDWPEADRRAAAALLDLLWSAEAYERLVAAWGFDTEEATRAVTGLVGLLVEAVREGRRPWLTG